MLSGETLLIAVVTPEHLCDAEIANFKPWCLCVLVG